MAEEKSRGKRVRVWAFVLYPESCAANWREQLDDLHIAYAVSPLHDQDVNPDGEPKKAHWHIILNFEGVKAYEQVNTICGGIGGTIPQPVDSVRGYVRYLAHLDNPEKFQYDRALIEARGGFDIAEYLQNTKTTELALMKEMVNYCIENDVTEYEDLVAYAMYNREDWFESLATKSTYFLNAFIKSHRHRKEKNGG